MVNVNYYCMLFYNILKLQQISILFLLCIPLISFLRMTLPPPQGGNSILVFVKVKHTYRKDSVKRISMDTKATVKIGEYSRGGSTRGDNMACDHDMGCKEKYNPCGIVDEDTGELFINFGSSYKTSDFIMDSLTDWWYNLSSEHYKRIELLQIKMDNGARKQWCKDTIFKTNN